MLLIASSVSQLNTEALMAVYQEGNEENARRFFPGLSPDIQLCKAEDGFIDYLRNDFFQTKGAFYAVWVCGETYTAALRMEPFKDGLLLEALETKPDMRRKGYAYSLIAAVLEYVPTLGYKKVYSHINKRNTASLRVHEKAGFRRISDSARYIDGTVTQNSYTLCYDTSND